MVIIAPEQDSMVMWLPLLWVTCLWMMCWCCDALGCLPPVQTVEVVSWREV